MNRILVLRETMVKQLSSIKNDNVSIADVVIARKPLVEALKLQTQSDVLTIEYGMVSGNFSIVGNSVLENEPCVQISCDHTVMRFLNRPYKKAHAFYDETQVKSLNFGIGHDVSGIPIDPKELLNAIQFVLPCISGENSRPYLQCLYIESGHDKLTLTCADGFRLANITIPLKGAPKSNLLIENIKDLVKFLQSQKPSGKGRNKTYPEVYLLITDKTLTLSTQHDTLVLNSMDAKFPDYSNLIPKSGNKTEFIASQLLEAVKIVAPASKDGSGIIRMVMSNNKISLSSRSEEIGDTVAECDAIVEADCRTAVNQRYLIAYLKSCGDNKVTMLKSDNDPSITFKYGNTQCVIMSMAVLWDDKPEPDDIELPDDEPTDNELAEILEPATV